MVDRYPTSWMVARDMGYSIKAIQTVTNYEENIKAEQLIERLMDLREYYYNSKLDCKWIDDFSAVKYFADGGIESINKSLTALHLEKKEQKSSNYQKLRDETFQMLLELRCVECFKLDKSLLQFPCGHFLLCLSCYQGSKNKTCELCDSPIESVLQVYRS